jgi:glycosyltransferase involved in cell wall biosynthesis
VATTLLSQTPALLVYVFNLGSAAPLLPVTLIVIARNEAKLIVRCLASVPFAAEKIVVDSGSTDRTRELAAAAGARVVHQDWLGFGPQRNFASELASHDWILMLDADEELSVNLIDEMRARLPEILCSQLAGAVLRRATRFMGAQMRWYRPMTGERIARLYHRRRARWTNARVHEKLHFDGKVTTFRQRVLHDHNPTLVHRQIKMLRYTELRAQDWRARGRKVRLWLCPFVFAATFFKDYFLRFGFLDGWRGYVISQVAASYAVYRRLRYYELALNPDSLQTADDVLQQHERQR